MTKTIERRARRPAAIEPIPRPRRKAVAKRAVAKKDGPATTRSAGAPSSSRAPDVDGPAIRPPIPGNGPASTFEPPDAARSPSVAATASVPGHTNGEAHAPDAEAHPRDPGPQAAGSAAAPGGKAKRESPPDAALRGRLDQFGAIFAKGIDLAEAGISLGVTIINRVGSAAEKQLRDRVGDTPPAAAPTPTPGQPMHGPAGDVMAAEEPAFGITNRLPLTPGATARISFSVNNDSMTEPKRVSLTIEPFIGDAHGFPLEPAVFDVKPARKAIAPADFEKFVLEGRVPAGAPPDIYRGAIVVSSGHDLLIPVVLVVAPL